MSDLASQKSCWRPKKALQYSWGSGGDVESVVGDVDSVPVLFAWSACTAVVLLVVLGDMVVDGIDVDFSSFSFERLDDVVFNGKVARSDGSVTLWNASTSSELFVVFACCRNSSKSAVKLFLASAFDWDFALEVLLHSPPNVIEDIKTTKDNPRTATESNYINGRKNISINLECQSEKIKSSMANSQLKLFLLLKRMHLSSKDKEEPFLRIRKISRSFQEYFFTSIKRN